MNVQRSLGKMRALRCGAIAAAVTGSMAVAGPLYQITPISLPGQANSNGQGISASGNFAAGTSNNTGVIWNQANGTVGLPALPGRAFSLVQDVNDSGVVVGTGATTFFGSSPLPVIWSNSTTVAQLPLPAGESLGRAFSINNSGQVVGSVNGGSLESAAMFTTGGSSIITQTMPNGGRLTTAYANNDAGRIVGQALNPGNAAVTNGFYIDPGDGTATDIGALTSFGHNSAIAFAVSSNGLIAGSSSLNSGAGALPFIWSEGGGMSAVPLIVGTTTGSARGVNADGWVVGNMSSATSIPFLYDGATTFRLQDLLDASGAGWDLVSGTSNGAFGIGDDGTITGRALLNGQVTGFVMTLIPEPTTLTLAGL
ncbi:MAG: hypothetical protein AB7N71_08560, partial [Phycisphaerae bacterium]